VDLRAARVRDLRRLIGLVTQQTLLFDDTVSTTSRTARYRPRATRSSRSAAGPRHRFIQEQLNNGYETVVGPAATGCRAPAAAHRPGRAILRNPDILLLDEATSQMT